MRYSLKYLLVEQMTNKAWSFFNGVEGFEQMVRKEVPAQERLNGIEMSIMEGMSLVNARLFFNWKKEKSTITSTTKK